jgi:hypothetical protein
MLVSLLPRLSLVMQLALAPAGGLFVAAAWECESWLSSAQGPVNQGVRLYVLEHHTTPYNHIVLVPDLCHEQAGSYYSAHTSCNGIVTGLSGLGPCYLLLHAFLLVHGPCADARLTRCPALATSCDTSRQSSDIFCMLPRCPAQHTSGHSCTWHRAVPCVAPEAKPRLR